MMTQEIELVSSAELARNQELLAAVDSLLDETRVTEDRLHRNFLEIGVAMLAVQKAKAWLARAKSWDSYVMDCGKRFGRGRTAIYSYTSVAERLLPHMPAKQLVEIGISKAQPLAQYAKRLTGKLPENLIESAINPEVGVEEFRASIAEVQHDKPEKGKWFDLGGFFCTADERIEIESGLERAETIEPLPEDTPAWLARKIAIQRLIAEFLSTYPCTENG
jgi:hypothetical protein